MLFPLGLNIRLKKIPIITLLLITMNFFFFFFNQSTYTTINSELIQAQRDSGYNSKKNLLQHQFNKSLEKNYDNIVDELINSDFFNEDLKLAKSPKEKLSLISNIYSKLNSKKVSKLVQINLMKKAFTKKLKDKDEAITGLPAYKDFKLSKEIFNRSTILIFKKYNLLSKNNNNFYANFIAQFNHVTLMHLVCNMLILLIFGVFLEQRISAYQYITMYLLAGSIGIQTEISFIASENYLLGASANVFGIIGCFYCLFFRFRMRFLVWYIKGKIVHLPIKYFIPALYFLTELVFLILPAQNNVANGAHISGASIGLIFGAWIRKKENIPYPNISKAELHRLNQYKQSTNYNLRFNLAVKLIKENPNQRELIIDLTSYLNIDSYLIRIRSDRKLLKTLHKEVPYIVMDFIKKDQLDKSLELLTSFSLAIDQSHLMSMLSPQEFIKVADFLFHNKNYYFAKKIYMEFLLAFPKSKEFNSIQKTIQEISNYNKRKSKKLAIQSLFLKDSNLPANLAQENLHV